MNLPVIQILWFIFIAYWVIAARGVKKDRGTYPRWWRWIAVLVIVLMLVPFQISALQFYVLPQTEIMRIIAVGLCATGIGFAIWARRHLGRNWSPGPIFKEDPELVTSGPYRFVRHPIYTGVLLALLGSILISTFPWWIMFIVFCL